MKFFGTNIYFKSLNFFILIKKFNKLNLHKIILIQKYSTSCLFSNNNNNNLGGEFWSH